MGGAMLVAARWRRDDLQLFQFTTHRAWQPKCQHQERQNCFRNAHDMIDTRSQGFFDLFLPGSPASGSNCCRSLGVHDQAIFHNMV